MKVQVTADGYRYPIWKMTKVVVMGVAGCGKSSLGQAVAAAEGLPLIEGDDFHSPSNRQKMAAGTPLSDADRDGWLDALAGELARHPQGLVLTCSALKRRYRDRLRSAAPDLRFVFLAIEQAEAERRVAARSSTHFFNPSLVASQFQTLETPVGEDGVLPVDALLPRARLQRQVTAWLHAGSPEDAR
jgi:gluconokinase